MNQKYFYHGTIIKLRYSPDNNYCDAGWYWEVFKDGVTLADNSKSCPDSLESALIFAKRCVDDALDIDSDEMPVLVLEH